MSSGGFQKLPRARLLPRGQQHPHQSIGHTEVVTPLLWAGPLHHCVALAVQEEGPLLRHCRRCTGSIPSSPPRLPSSTEAGPTPSLGDMLPLPSGRSRLLIPKEQSLLHPSTVQMLPWQAGPGRGASPGAWPFSSSGTRRQLPRNPGPGAARISRTTESPNRQVVSPWSSVLQAAPHQPPENRAGTYKLSGVPKLPFYQV